MGERSGTSQLKKEYRFQKKDRLLKRQNFLLLSQSRKKVENTHFIAVLKKNNVHRLRLGVTVSKRVGHAVIRNKLKRLLREYFRLNRQKIEGSLDIHIIAKKNSATIGNIDIYSSLDQLFQSIKRKING
jgi:ribonuclease P protein component